MKNARVSARFLAGALAVITAVRLAGLRAASGPVLSNAERRTLRDAPGDDFDSLGSFDVGQMRARLAQVRQGVPATGAAAAAPARYAAADCETPPTPIVPSSNAAETIDGRAFPSAFQAWTPASNTGSANHDLIWGSPSQFGLKCYNTDLAGNAIKQPFPGLCTTFLPALPPSAGVVRLAEIRWYDGWYSADSSKPGDAFLPADSPLWLNGGPSNPANRTPTTMSKPAYRLDVKSACLKKQAALQCQAAVKAGFDGCMFDRWPSAGPDALDMLKKVRAAVGNALILVNDNGKVPADLSDVNGVFAEGFGASFFSPGGAGGNGDVIPYPKPEAWRYLIENLKKLKGARRPQINAIEGWGEVGDSRYLRALTTLVLVHSNAYVLYSRSNAFQAGRDHSHAWDDFWTQDLGQPVEQDPPDPPLAIAGGAVYRRFSKGIAVYNPTSAPVTVPSSLLRGMSRSHRLKASLLGEVQVPAGDGDIFVR